MRELGADAVAEIDNFGDLQAALELRGLDASNYAQVKAQLSEIEQVTLSLTDAAQSSFRTFQDATFGSILAPLEEDLKDGFAAFNVAAESEVRTSGEALSATISDILARRFGDDFAVDLGQAAAGQIADFLDGTADFLLDLEAAASALDLSQLGADFREFLGQLADLLGLDVDGFGDGLIQLAEAATRLSESGKIGVVFDELIEAAEVAIPVIRAIKDTLLGLVDANLDNIGEIILILGGLRILTPVVGTVAKLAEGFAALSGSTGILTGLSKALPTAARVVPMAALAVGIAGVVANSESLQTALGALADITLDTLVISLETVAEVFDKMTEGIGNDIDEIVGFIDTLADRISLIGESSLFREGSLFGDTLNAGQGFFVDLADTFADTFEYTLRTSLRPFYLEDIGIEGGPSPDEARAAADRITSSIESHVGPVTIEVDPEVKLKEEEILRGVDRLFERGTFSQQLSVESVEIQQRFDVVPEIANRGVLRNDLRSTLLDEFGLENSAVVDYLVAVAVGIDNGGPPPAEALDEFLSQTINYLDEDNLPLIELAQQLSLNPELANQVGFREKVFAEVARAVAAADNVPPESVIVALQAQIEAFGLDPYVVLQQLTAPIPDTINKTVGVNVTPNLNIVGNPYAFADAGGAGVIPGLPDRVQQNVTMDINVVPGTISGVESLSNSLDVIDGRNAMATVSQTGAEAAAGLVGDLTDSISAVPDKTVEVGERGAIAAKGRVDALKAAIDALSSKTVNVTANVSGTSAVLALASAIRSVQSQNVSIRARALAIQQSAEGRIVRQPIITHVGEGYKPEAIIPMTKPRRALQLLQESGLDRLLFNAALNGKISTPRVSSSTSSRQGNVTTNDNSQTTTNFYIQTRPGQDPGAVGRSLADELSRLGSVR